MDNKDILFMKRALALARRAQGLTSPNPMVGAVIVKNGRIISQGYHKKAGSAHAEIEAIRHANVSLKGATIYITLEPCFHFGRTPPCVDEIINQKFAKAVIAVKDPNVLVSGKSITKLKNSGIKVIVRVCEYEATRLNEIFFKNQKNHLPFVAVKIAQTLDGKIASSKQVSKWITSLTARNYAKRLRDRYDCVLVGANTLKSDNPSLDGAKTSRFKAVVTSGLDLPSIPRAFRQDPSRNIVITSPQAKQINPKFPAKIIKIKPRGKVIPAKNILKKMYESGIMSIFIEGGATTTGYFFDAGLVDKVYFFIAPKILGGAGAISSVGAGGFNDPGSCPLVRDVKIKKVGPDFLVEGYPVYKKK